MSAGALIRGLMALFLVFGAGCDIIPSSFNLGIQADIDTTSELGPDTLERVDAVNETLATGIEVGPETRATIEELNQTIADGVKAGFDEETLAAVDALLRVVEDGLKIGLDNETLNTIDGMVNSIDEMPGNWENSAQDIIQTLDSAAGSTAKKLANEVSDLMNEARLNYQQMTAITGIEFRCNVDFMGSKIGATAQEFIGKSIVGRLRNILSGEPQAEPVPIPWVCQVIPDTLYLSQAGDRLVFEEGIVTLTGYNYVSANTPSASIVDEAGQSVPGIPLYPYLSSPYQIQLNMQDLDLSQVPARARLVFTWPNVDDASGIAILLPGHQAPVASFTAEPMSGNAPLTVQFHDTSLGNPTSWQWVFGDGSTSLQQNPTHTFIDDHDFQVQLTAQNDQGQSTVTNTIAIGAELTADFHFSPSGGPAQLLVSFTDDSRGNPTSWLWDFGDGQMSDEQNPQHLYLNSSAEGYPVSLTVQNAEATSTKTSPDRIKVMETLDADFKADLVSGRSPLEVTFTDLSKGGNSIIGWLWDFGDGTSASTLQSPTHTYSKNGNFDVSLTIARGDGEKDVEVKNAYINAYSPKRLTTTFVLGNVYFTAFNATGGMPVDTRISYSKYVCGINGFVANDGVLPSGHRDMDGLRLYMYPQISSQTNTQTWWLIADLYNQSNSWFGEEKWYVYVMCFNRSLEGNTFLYRDDFKNIKGGTPRDTGIKTDEYFSCSIMGVAGLGSTGFPYNTVFPMVIQETVDGSGSNWVIKSDMPVDQDGDTWDVRLLCLKRSSDNNVEKPPFITRSYSFQSSISNQFGTEISAADYLCGVSGYTAERADIKVPDPNQMMPAGDPSPYLSPNVLTVRATTRNGVWWVEGNVDNRIKAEDWTIGLMCVSRAGRAREGTPP